MAKGPGRQIFIGPSPELTRLLGYWGHLDRLYGLFGEAAKRVESAIGRPICIERCGACCQVNTAYGYGVEAEYVASWLLGQPLILRNLLDRCEAWLTRRGHYTYGRGISHDNVQQLQAELQGAIGEPCPFLGDDKRCLIHPARPFACRAYGVTHLPSPTCPRPLGLGEHAGGRALWDDSDPRLPLRALVETFLGQVQEVRFSRHGFLPTMVFERLAAKKLAGLLDDMRIPLVKVMVQSGPGYMVLWQEQWEKMWSAQGADRSIATQVPLVEKEGKPVMVVGNVPGGRP